MAHFSLFLVAENGSRDMALGCTHNWNSWNFHWKFLPHTDTQGYLVDLDGFPQSRKNAKRKTYI